MTDCFREQKEQFKPTDKWIEELEKAKSNIVWAANLYSQAGDETNTRRQYRKLADEARALLMNDTNRIIESLINHMRKHAD
jgi:hypothetical protein